MADGFISINTKNSRTLRKPPKNSPAYQMQMKQALIELFHRSRTKQLIQIMNPVYQMVGQGYGGNLEGDRAEL